MQDFVHLHVHTYYSILDGQSAIDKLVDKAIADGMRGMAITDHGNMFGVKEFFDYCEGINAKRRSEGKEPFKPVFGCEMYVARRGKEQKEHEHGDMGGNHLVVLAKNETGYHNLIRLVSHAWTEGFYMRPRTDRKELERYHEGLIICSACIAGEVPEKILKGDIRGAREAIEWFHGIWGEDYYLELQRHEVTDPATKANRETFPLQQKANKVLIELAREYGIKLVCTNDCHFVDEENAEAHDRLLCVSTNKDLDDPNRMRYTKQEWFKTREEMNTVFADIPEALSNTCEVLDKVEFYDINHSPIMPFFPIPETFGTEEEWRKKYTREELYREFTTDERGFNPLPEAEGAAKIERLGGYEKLYRIKFEADYLALLSYAGARRLYGDPLPEEVDERIRFELHVMKTMGFPGYFLIVQDFINAARNELGVRVGPGRGSAAGSVVAYCLGITRIDPLKYNLLFERFLNPDRVSLPDIDTDFDDEGRGRVLQWVMNKYGAENCAHIITFGTMAVKNALKDVARVEKVPLDVVNRWCREIPAKLPGGAAMSVKNVVKYIPALQEAAKSNDRHYANTIKYAQMLEGTVRGTGIHACGFIICQDPIIDHVPVSTADDPDFPDTKTTVTQYDGHYIEDTGLIKMDFLGLSTLTEQKEAIKNIKLTTGIDVDIDNIPLNDEETYKLYQRGQTVGTFQFESPNMQKFLRELHPTVFEDLIAMNALYRPGPLDYIPSFIRRKNGKEKIEYDLPCMEKYLKETYGITVYQEQVMLLSRLLAGFTRGESDALRKAMGKKKKMIVDQMKPKFIEGGRRNGHDPKILEKIWADWEKFASYAFNKSHAACYSWVAYQTAYLKAHYPAEFMAAIMTCRRDDIIKLTKLLDECKAMHIATLGPDINESFADFGVNERGEIRFGLAAVKGIGSAAAEVMISERLSGGPYKSLIDFIQRTNFDVVNRKVIEALALSGALDAFGLDREQYVTPYNNKEEAFIDALIRFGWSYQRTLKESSVSLFGFDDISDTIQAPNPPKNYPKWSSIERLNKEKEMTGIYLSAHPLDDYKIILQSMCNTHCSELKDKDILAERGNVTFAGIVTSVRKGYTKRGNLFGAVKIEDYEGAGELVLFDNWQAWSEYFTENALVYVHAVCAKMRGDYINFNITNVEHPGEAKKRIEKITIAITNDISIDTVADLTALIKNNKGNTSVDFNIYDKPSDSNIILHSKNDSVELAPDLISFIEANPETEYYI
ncbi:MAG: DNA polymerase III subunit alpha [Prevotella sp.]|nr:DNA polymerase III subunit alpha [Prevotella sp.]